jgi:hypothetical protein
MAGKASGEDDQPSHSGLIARLEGSRMQLMDAIAGLDEPGFRARTSPGERTVAEILAHLLLSERATVDATITPSAVDPNASGRAAQRMAVPQIVHGLLAQRRDTVHALDTGRLDAAALDDIVRHELEHAAQIREQRSRADQSA